MRPQSDHPLDGRRAAPVQPEISQEAARAMLAALRLALPELREALETLVESCPLSTTTWTADQPLRDDFYDASIRDMAQAKKAAYDAAIAAIAQAEGR
jgi:hypothetical protein